MTAPDALNEEATALVHQIAELVRGRTVAVAESLTGGKLACHLAAAPGSGDWFRGGVVAYASEVKHTLLGVPDGPVVSAESAAAMATGVARALGADAAVAVTGVGGPDEQEGQPVGTVWFGATAGGDATTERQQYGGDPVEVLDQTVVHALRMLRTQLAG